ncbi:bifunctional (p)ppGpp synthetase/guanosine-3',5'-bis(diphosphate) 3'-pyrophosphohydrolase [Thiohalocapsa marina]|uniref:Bifunctional (P)ppGpp synthetase/guanosine-3',5'-bis(Diphosphate) 3'-pyrophosphohydrolase n=1 Tax=Thiohalocapsa marina TaxID=424902 RepID=A0A5M8FCW3_9GAMM|nr:HD domain-containing protein [Thiohalocapsa marina]KAA6182517.1 bifunctional (p)ppGpp synthetase/guanosine-3',5'-bis(diphosphate) 3'-pyrophosphohydrolase [Thiohalocapsa marina]
MNDLIAHARRFATEAHQRIDQRRKYTNQPYQEHLKAVAELVAGVTDDPEMIAAAWLHDTVEDTPATFGDIERAFGRRVRELVAHLTDVSKPADGNRAVRKAIDRHHTAQAPVEAKTIKLADLIDNCRDICRHDAKFGRVYLAEAAALLEVLADADERLYRLAQKTLAQCAQRLGLPAPQQAAIGEEAWRPHGNMDLSQRRALRVFTEAFTAREVARPLRSFDSERVGDVLAQLATRAELEVFGLRRDGVCVGYLCAQSLQARDGEMPFRSFAPAQVLQGDAALSEVIHVLTRYDFCFVTAMGDVAGVICRGDMQQPIVRMWLFGIITLLELELLERIRSCWPDGSWTERLSAGRLSKAQALLEERRRIGQHVDLADCLQLSDKAQIVMEDEQQRLAFGLRTKGAAKRVIKDLESLRNNLAHAQDIVSHDWPQIARLAQRIEEMWDRHGTH